MLDTFAMSENTGSIELVHKQDSGNSPATLERRYEQRAGRTTVVYPRTHQLFAEPTMG